MGYVIQAGETDGTKLRVPLTIINTDGTEHAASLSGVKARLSINGGTAANSTNDVTRVDAGTCYVQLTTGEAATFTAGDRVTVKVPASGTRMVALALVEVAADNLYAAAPTAASVATAVWSATTRELTTMGVTIREAIADTLLGRNVAGGSSGGRTVSLFFFKGVNRWLRRGPSNTLLDVYGTNDATVAATETLTLDANGNVIGSDPA